jgi:23S rRNA (uracil1939-C5)-methyltransferase
MSEEWTIERLVPGGDGFARLSDGRVGFATGALPGDRIVVMRAEHKKSYSRAQRWELAQPSPDRVEPPCPIADRCGGCNWMRLARPAQVAAKSSILAEALARVGRFRDLGEIPMVLAGSDLHYRSRLRVHVDSTARLGLYAKKSHEVVALERCAVSHPEIDRALSVLRNLAQRHQRAMAAFKEIEIRIAPGGPLTTLWMIPRQGHAEHTAELVADVSKHFPVSIAGEPGGVADQRWPLPNGLELFAPPGAFTQVNWEVNLALVRAVLDGASERGAKSFLDLYCGAGNFSLPLLRAGLSGLGIDRTGGGIRAARRAAEHFDLNADAFVAADVGEELERLVGTAERFDLVLLDPPRTGARGIAAKVSALAPKHLAMCSCDPPTFARDLRAFADVGFELSHVIGFDMFPHTHHVEALGWMRRAGSGA